MRWDMERSRRVEPFDVGRRGDVEQRHRHLLGVNRQFAGVERARDRPGEQRVLEQLGQRPAEAILAGSREALAQAPQRIVGI